eukprot:966077-Pyramimonas_sp.AAC.1
MKEIWLTTIAPQQRRTTGGAGTARSQLHEMIPTGIKPSFEWEAAMYKFNMAMHDMHFTSKL